MLARVVVEQVGRGLADALAQASGGLPELARFHLHGDGFGLLQRLAARFHGEHGLQRVGRPIPVPGIDPGEDVAFEMHHAPLVARPGQQLAHRSDQSGAPVAGHQSHAFEPAREHTGDEPAPAFRVLLQALRHREHLPAAVHADAYGHQDAHVLHRASPAAPVPHAVHEHIRIILDQGTVAPCVDIRVDAFEPVAQGLRGHAVAPQELADIVDLAGGHAGQVLKDFRQEQVRGIPRRNLNRMPPRWL